MAPATPPPPPTDEPRVVIDYSGMQVLDCREHIQIRLTDPPPKGLRWSLKDAGFRPMPESNTWQRPHTPDAIFKAQTIGRAFFNSNK